MTLPVLIGIAVSALGNLLHIVGLATTSWFVQSDKSISYGLFRGCYGSICGNIDSRSKTSSLKATSALCVIGCLLGLASLLLAILFKSVSSLQKKIIPMLYLMAGCASCGAIILGVIIYVADYYKSEYGDLGFSFALSLVGGIVIGAGSLLAFIGGRNTSAIN